LTPEEREEAQRLLRAARSDLRAVKALAGDSEQENDVVGFHAQQAVEKALKAVLAAGGTEVPYTHDVSFMLDAAGVYEVAIPREVADAEWLTPWAVAMRYGGGDFRLDRGAAMAAATVAVEWAERILNAGPETTSA